MTMDGFLDAWAEDSKDYKPGDQARRRETEGFAVWRMAPDWLG
jgi:hypothetical protein